MHAGIEEGAWMWTCEEESSGLFICLFYADDASLLALSDALQLTVTGRRPESETGWRARSGRGRSYCKVTALSVGWTIHAFMQDSGVSVDSTRVCIYRWARCSPSLWVTASLLCVVWLFSRKSCKTSETAVKSPKCVRVCGEQQIKQAKNDKL